MWTVFRVVPVRQVDIRKLREFGPPVGVELPERHGRDGDPRYPSPYRMRLLSAIAVDMIIHLGGAIGTGVALARVPSVAAYAGFLGVGAYIVLSFVHRVFVQRAAGTTVGKALFGLRVIRDDTGGRPTLGSLVKAWFVGVGKGILNVVSTP